MDWCPVCCTQHATRPECPGELLATGPERHGARLSVWTGTVSEVYGVLVAESGGLWRSRILTYPNMLWSVPGGRGTLKFVGASAQEVERKALDFLRRHCVARGTRILEESAEVEVGAVEPEAAPDANPRGGKDERLPHGLPVRFGETKPTLAGRTADLSYGGLFIVTDNLLVKGLRIKIMLQLDQFSIPLVGTIAWRRQGHSGGKPAGMGIELQGAPAMYVRYVESIKRSADADADADAVPATG